MSNVALLIATVIIYLQLKVEEPKVPLKKSKKVLGETSAPTE